ncbi:MAG: CHAT domain-containing protein [Caldilineaceae bacterium]|nr:CHAT domain-containing protein [Caldilineaceae bacterium]
MPATALVDQILALPSQEAQLALMRELRLDTIDGLEMLLDAAEHLGGDNPENSYRLAQTVEAAATGLNSPALTPRAQYLQAQALAIRGHFDDAERLIVSARVGYAAQGMQLPHWRTTAGLMRVLGETGRYEEALAAAQQTLAEIGAHPEGEPTEIQEYRIVAAMLFQNSGYCYEQIAQYDAALQAYAAAERRYAAAGMDEARGQILENRGLVLVALGEVQAGLRAFEQALAIYDADARTLFQAQTYLNIGEAHLLLSNFLLSLQAFEEAARRFSQIGETVDRYILLRQMGDAYLALNLHAEAEDAYRQARDGLAAAGLTLHYALTQWGLGAALAGRGRLDEAEQAVADAASRLRQLRNHPLHSAALLEASRLRELAGDLAAARLLAQEALALASTDQYIVQQVYACLRNAELALPDLTAAEAFLTQAQPLVDRLHLPHFHYRIQQRWGRLRLAQGHADAAQPHLEQAIAQIEQLRSTLVQERMRASFLIDKTAAYHDLVQLHLDRGDVASVHAAFAVAEQARSRALADLIAGVIQIKLVEGADDETARQLEQLQAELNAVYSELLGGPDDGSVRTASAAMLQARATSLAQAISRLRLKQSLDDAVLSPQSSPPNPWQSVLDEGSPPLIAYQILGDEILAFVCCGGRIATVRRLSSMSRIQQLSQRLSVQWDRFRIHPALIAQHQAQFQQSAQRLLHQLYHELMAPLLPLVEDGARVGVEGPGKLVVVPQGLLHQLPFHAFFDGKAYLLERYAFSYAPSATVLALCSRRARRARGEALIMAAPDGQIPAAEAEANQVTAGLQPTTRLLHTLLRDEATLPALQTIAGRCDIVHLACHGIFRRDNPMFSALKLHDGWFTAADLARLDLAGALVTLSACESGRSHAHGGDEILGLIYALLGAGAATLVVSQWLVQDAVTATLMTRWYERLRNFDDLSLALRSAQLEVMADHPHPFFWAPFFLVGQRAPL